MRELGFGIVVSVAVILSGCGGSSSHGGGGSTPGLIGPSGGTLAVDGRTSTISGSRIVVPAGAVTAPTQFTLQAGTQVSKTNYGAAGPAVQAGPSGTTFGQPLLVIVPVTPPFPNGATINQLVVLQRDDSTGSVTVLTPASVDGTNNTLTVSVTRLSTFEGAELLPVSAASSTVVASPTTLLADGVTKSTITVTVKDTAGAAYQNQPVTVTLSSTGTGNTITQPTGSTDANGIVTGTIVSTVAEAKTISATAGGVAITQAVKVTFTVVTPAPTVASVNTNNGYARGGNVVTVGGTDFTGATTVDFGGVAALFTVVSATQLTAAAPASAPRTVDVTVTTPSGTSATSASDRYTYLPDEYLVVDNGRALVFSGTVTGSVSPGRTLTTNNFNLNGISVDLVHDEFAWTTGSGGISVDFYPRTATSGPPVRSIVGAATGLSNPAGVAIDVAHDEVVVTNAGNSGSSITVYSRTATGNTAPLRTITGASTGLNVPDSVSVDTFNNELFVANYAANTITVHSRTATGNAAPLRTIGGAATGLSSPATVVVDPIHNEIVVTNQSNNTIAVFSRTASGNAAPLRTITGVSAPAGLALDLIDDEIVVVSSNAVRVYARTASGSAAPLRTFTSSAFVAPVLVGH